MSAAAIFIAAIAVVMIAVTIPVLVGFAALTIDVGIMYNTRADLQRAADAGAMAAAQAMTNGDPNVDRVTRARKAARDFVERNPVLGHQVTVGENDIIFGRTSFNEGSNSYTFTPNEFGPDAVRVTVRQTSGSSNGATQLYFAAIFGKHRTDISASATAAISPRDMSLVVDLSRSTNFDSALRHAKITNRLPRALISFCR